MTFVYTIWLDKIIKCEVIKKTQRTIVLNQEWNGHPWHRTFKVADGKVFDTWQEAHLVLMASADEAVRVARLRLEQFEDRAGQIRGMKPPTEEDQ